jgi:hypothetical protein
MEAFNTVGVNEENLNDYDLVFAHQEFKGCSMGAITSNEGDEWKPDCAALYRIIFEIILYAMFILLFAFKNKFICNGVNSIYNWGNCFCIEKNKEKFVIQILIMFRIIFGVLIVKNYLRPIQFS